MSQSLSLTQFPSWIPNLVLGVPVPKSTVLVTCLWSAPSTSHLPSCLTHSKKVWTKTYYSTCLLGYPLGCITFNQIISSNAGQKWGPMSNHHYCSNLGGSGRNWKGILYTLGNNSREILSIWIINVPLTLLFSESWCHCKSPLYIPHTRNTHTHSDIQL